MSDESEQARKLRVAKRIAAVVATVVALIFAGAAFLGYVVLKHDRPAKQVFFGDEPS